MSIRNLRLDVQNSRALLLFPLFLEKENPSRTLANDSSDDPPNYRSQDGRPTVPRGPLIPTTSKYRKNVYATRPYHVKGLGCLEG